MKTLKQKRHCRSFIIIKIAQAVRNKLPHNVKGFDIVDLKSAKACQDVVDSRGWLAINRHNTHTFNGTSVSCDGCVHLVSANFIVDELDNCLISNKIGVNAKTKVFTVALISEKLR